MLSRKLLVLLILANFLFICVHQSFFWTKHKGHGGGVFRLQPFLAKLTTF